MSWITTANEKISQKRTIAEWQKEDYLGANLQLIKENNTDHQLIKHLVVYYPLRSSDSSLTNQWR